MKKIASLVLAATLSVSLFGTSKVTVNAKENKVNIEVEENYEIYPVPQKEVYLGSSFKITDEVNIVIEDGIDQSTKNFIIEILKNNGIKNVFSNEAVEDKTNIIIGVKDSDKYVDKYFDENIKYDEKIFSEEDAYVLKADDSVEENGTVAILGETTDAAYYGLATLKMILNQVEDKEIREVMYEDFADAKWRGFIEGFYGYPWSNEDRKSLMEFGGQFKMNSYIFAPKDDPYHNRQWRELYPPDKLAEIKELAEVGIKSKTKFVWAIHPGFNMINWNDYDNELQTLLNKLDQLYSVGVRQFGLFMDDISTDQSLRDKEKHVKLVTDVANWVKAKGDCYSLVYCPPYYNQGWTGEKGKPYLRALKDLPENVEVMWTGATVCAKVIEEDMQWPKDLIGRDTYMWLNWPVNGHKLSRLMLGKGEVMTPGVHNISGLVTNPLEYAELSKTAIFATADYAWNTDDFNDDKSWADSFKYINPEVAEEFHIIASHLSDPSPTDRNLVLEESEYLKEDLELFLNNYRNGKDITKVGNKLIGEFDKILNAIEVFNSEKNLNENMKDEIKPWLGSLEYITKSCTASVKSAMGLRASNLDTAWTELSNATNYKQKSKTFTTRRLGAPDIVVESGAKRLIPFATELINSLDSQIYMQLDPEVSSRTPMASYKSNKLDLMVDGNKETFAYFQTLQKVGDWYGVDLGRTIDINDIEIIQGRNDKDHDIFHKGILEYSENGKDWTPIGEERTGFKISANNLNVKARYIRYRATVSGVPGGKPDLWTAVREITINKGDTEPVLYTNIDNINNISINHSNLKTEIVNVSNITLKPNEYLGIKLTGIERLSEVLCEASSKNVTLEVSSNGVEWVEGNKATEGRYIRVINKGNENVTFNLDKLSVKLDKFEDPKITHNYPKVHNGKIDDLFDKNLQTKVWFGGPQKNGSYVQIDLGGVVDVDKIDLVIGDSEKDYFRNGNLEVSLDGIKWETVESINGGTRETNFPTLKAPYRYRTVSGINKKARYVRLISNTENKAWFAINEILINDGVENSNTTNPALVANPEGAIGNSSDMVFDKKLATFYTPEGDSLDGELTYKLSDYTDVGELIILQGPSGISNANVEVRDLNGWHKIGTLSKSYNHFNISRFENALEVKLSWSEAKPVINEIITVKKNDSNTEMVNKSDLEKVLAQAKDIVENHSDKYTKETIDALKNVIAKGDEALANEYIDQEQVDAIKSQIEEAISKLEDNKKPEVKVDKTNLKNIIDEVNALDKDKYTEETWSKLEEVLSEANKVLEDEEATQKEVNNAIDGLINAKDSLVEKDNTTENNGDDNNGNNDNNDSNNNDNNGNNGDHDDDNSDDVEDTDNDNTIDDDNNSDNNSDLENDPSTPKTGVPGLGGTIFGGLVALVGGIGAFRKRK